MLLKGAYCVGEHFVDPQSASLNDQNYPRYPLVLNLNVTLARPLRLVILYFFKWKILSDDRRLYLHNSK